MKKVFAIIILILCIVLVGCKSYEDTNGPDNYSLETITDEMIIKGTSSSSVGMISSKKTNDGDTTIKEKVKRFNGVRTLYTLEKNTSYVLALDASVTKGNARIIIVSDTEILADFLVNGEDQLIPIDTSIAGDSKVYIKIAGEACSYEIELKIDKR